jgi:Na+/H+-dicarboxylate symporter/ABC-type amino acid transport substrate-binding protein
MTEENNASPVGKAVPKKTLSLSAKIIIGLVAGIACGLFFGEHCGWLESFGDAFVNLLQMTVLPYITCSLVLNIGRLSPRRARKTFLIGGVVLLVLWFIAAVIIALAPNALPEVRMGSFFSSEAIQEPSSFDFVDLYIPANPFHSLANAVVPAVVVFSIFLGIALMGVEDKQPLMGLLETFCESLVRVNGYVMRLTPYGMFAIAAAAAGTMTLAEVERLEAYFLVYIACAVLLTFWVLPTVVASITPLTSRQVLNASKDALVTAFATGKTFVVLPLLVAGAARLFRDIGIEDEEANAEAGLLVPLAYPFPTVGKLLALLFIPFGAWYVGQGLAIGQYAVLLSSGVLALFGSPVAAIPFLLDLFRLPADLFNLFLISGVVSARLSDVVGAMHLMVFTLAVGCGMAGLLKVRLRRLVVSVAVGLAVFAAVVAAIQMHVAASAAGRVQPDVLADMSLRVPAVEHTILEHGGPNPVPLVAGENRLDRIRRRGVIRIGYHPDEIPFSYVNSAGDLVGFDVEMAHRIALEIGVAIEFVPLDFDALAAQLESDHYDLAMAGIVGSYHHLPMIQYADSLVELTGALVVPDYRRGSFASRSAINALGPVRIGIVGHPRVSHRFTEGFPGIELVTIDSHLEFFERRRPDLDGLAVVAEQGAAWTMRYPEYAVVIPSDVEIKSPLVYPMAMEADELEEFVERWAVLASGDGTTQEMYRYWILGRGVVDRQPRWSVIRDVLGWVD